MGFGVTGFTGQLCAEYMFERDYDKDTDDTAADDDGNKKKAIKWATSARNPIKAKIILKDLAMQCNPPRTDEDVPPVLKADLVCDSPEQEEILRNIVKKTKVVLTCSGPFEKYSKTLVKLCAELGVYYADITGETDFVRHTITNHDKIAQESGAVIISHCGNDCIPCDLTVYEMNQYAKTNGCELTEVRTYEDVPPSASMSGGTISTASYQLNKDRSTKNNKNSSEFDPLLSATNGTKSEYTTKNICPKSNISVPDLDRNAGPWIMGPVMMNCVRRSNALIGYSKDFQYGDALLQQDSYMGQLKQMGTFALTAGYVTVPSVFQYFVPKPGEGPSRENMENGFLTLHGFGTMVNKQDGKERKLSSKFQFNKDTGYLYTAVLLIETGMLLVKKYGSLSGGCQTPASALGNELTQRILQEMDTSFEIKEI